MWGNHREWNSKFWPQHWVSPSSLWWLFLILCVHHIFHFFPPSLTIPMRDKEKVHDYRFMPEPNLPPLHVYNDLTMPSCLNSTQIVNIDELRRQLPPLPSQIRAQLQENHGLSLEQADTIMVSCLLPWAVCCILQDQFIFFCAQHHYNRA